MFYCPSVPHTTFLVCAPYRSWLYQFITRCLQRRNKVELKYVSLIGHANFMSSCRKPECIITTDSGILTTQKILQHIMEQENVNLTCNRTDAHSWSAADMTFESAKTCDCNMPPIPSTYIAMFGAKQISLSELFHGTIIYETLNNILQNILDRDIITYTLLPKPNFFSPLVNYVTRRDISANQTLLHVNKLRSSKHTKTKSVLQSYFSKRRNQSTQLTVQINFNKSILDTRADMQILLEALYLVSTRLRHLYMFATGNTWLDTSCFTQSIAYVLTLFADIRQLLRRISDSIESIVLSVGNRTVRFDKTRIHRRTKSRIKIWTRNIATYESDFWIYDGLVDYVVDSITLNPTEQEIEILFPGLTKHIKRAYKTSNIKPIVTLHSYVPNALLLYYLKYILYINTCEKTYDTVLLLFDANHMCEQIRPESGLKLAKQMQIGANYLILDFVLPAKRIVDTVVVEASPVTYYTQFIQTFYNQIRKYTDVRETEPLVFRVQKKIEVREIPALVYIENDAPFREVDVVLLRR